MRIKTDGGYYVATSPDDWTRAIERMKRQVRERDARMAEWERANRPGCYPTSEYWDAYRAEKERVPVDYPLPMSHVMFDR